MYNLKTLSPEELKELITKAEQEIKDRATAQVEEKKAKVVIAIRELLAVCRSAGVRSLGKIEWECGACYSTECFDILTEDVLYDVANILEGKY